MEKQVHGGCPPDLRLRGQSSTRRPSGNTQTVAPPVSSDSFFGASRVQPPSTASATRRPSGNTQALAPPVSSDPFFGASGAMSGARRPGNTMQTFNPPVSSGNTFGASGNLTGGRPAGRVGPTSSSARPGPSYEPGRVLGPINEHDGSIRGNEVVGPVRSGGERVQYPAAAQGGAVSPFGNSGAASSNQDFTIEAKRIGEMARLNNASRPQAQGGQGAFGMEQFEQWRVGNPQLNDYMLQRPHISPGYWYTWWVEWSAPPPMVSLILPRYHVCGYYDYLDDLDDLDLEYAQARSARRQQFMGDRYHIMRGGYGGGRPRPPRQEMGYLPGGPVNPYIDGRYGGRY